MSPENLELQGFPGIFSFADENRKFLRKIGGDDILVNNRVQGFI